MWAGRIIVGRPQNADRQLCSLRGPGVLGQLPCVVSSPGAVRILPCVIRRPQFADEELRLVAWKSRSKPNQISIKLASGAGIVLGTPTFSAAPK